jgi:hypothetical protein
VNVKEDPWFDDLGRLILSVATRQHEDHRLLVRIEAALSELRTAFEEETARLALVNRLLEEGRRPRKRKKS